MMRPVRFGQHVMVVTSKKAKVVFKISSLVSLQTSGVEFSNPEDDLPQPLSPSGFPVIINHIPVLISF